MDFRSQLWLLVVGCLLSGCDTFEDIAASQPTPVIEIRAGYKVQIDGKPVSISGTSQCFNDKSSNLSSTLPPLHECVVIAPETKAVEVWVDYPDRPLKEVWTVKKVGEQTLLTRGDGSYVVAAN